MALFARITQEKCKLLCFDYLSKFMNHKSKKIRRRVALDLIGSYRELLKKEPDWFDYAVSILDLPPANESFWEFSIMLNNEINSFNNEQIAFIIGKYEKFLQKTKNDFYKKTYTQLVKLLKKHISGETVLKPQDLLKDA